MGTSAGLEIKSWKPAPKVMHPSGIVYEIPISVDVMGHIIIWDIFSAVLPN